MKSMKQHKGKGPEDKVDLGEGKELKSVRLGIGSRLKMFNIISY